ncbi:alpha/beta fold hydrolase [Kribbella italica]|uniref:Pimeloyl-ACP methyl ester carboxylesterase n=1 Tax=Kribbella italica TaxID=1540520 RepID=A0A7W9MVD9_9ACTN|nr:alpha/beta hydrolase [Kribbella italica]MBB5837182.1 pimeloyl-ACP methyl ester carboxylesterase [Kribbella italica]
MTQTPDPILLLSGAGLPHWIWDQVRKELSASPTVVAERPRQAHASLTEYAAAALDSAPWDRFVVVAHSSGGTVAAEMVALAPDRVTALLAVTAVVPQPGRSFVTSMPFPRRLALSLAMRLAGTRPPDSAIRKGLAGRLDQETADRIVADFTAESAHLYRDKSEGTFPEHRGYLSTAQDAELPTGLQRRFAQNLTPAWNESISTGHLPMLEAPELLAQHIESFLAEAPISRAS